jgi:hypothetical protein
MVATQKATRMRLADTSRAREPGLLPAARLISWRTKPNSIQALRREISPNCSIHLPHPAQGRRRPVFLRNYLELSTLMRIPKVSRYVNWHLAFVARVIYLLRISLNDHLPLPSQDDIDLLNPIRHLRHQRHHNVGEAVLRFGCLES